MYLVLILLITISVIYNVISIGNITRILLLGGRNQTEGRITILYNGQYGTVCDDLFDLESANVVCRQLNFTGALSVTSNFGAGRGPIWLDDVECNGTETSIEYCSHGGFGVHNCNHNNDVGVVCACTYLSNHYSFNVILYCLGVTKLSLLN